MTEPESATKNEDGTWLVRQWQKVRELSKRDVVLAQIGSGNTNVIVGTRNVQINIDGRNLVAPVLLIPLLLLAIIGILLYPTVIEPRFYPGQMNGRFNIAVAQIGELDASGRVRAVPFGQTLTHAIADGLCRQYLEFPDVIKEAGGSIWIWRDGEGGDSLQHCTDQSDKNIQFGVISGGNETERRENAEALRDRIGANMLVYGYLTDEGERESLKLEFVYSSPNVESEFDLVGGRHRVGQELELPISYREDELLAVTKISDPLAERSTALFWIATGLTYDVLGELEISERYFRAAQNELDDEGDDSGQSVLYFLLGRVALFQQDTEKARDYFERSLSKNADYTRSHIALGSTYLQQARGLSHVERRESEPDVLELATAAHEKGLQMALAEEDPFLVTLARVALAKSYQLVGATHAQFAEYATATEFYDRANRELDQVMATLLQTDQYRLIAQAHEAQGAIYYQQAQVLRNQDNIAGSQEKFEDSRDAYERCIAQATEAPGDSVLQDEIIDDFCRPNRDKAEERLAELAGR